MTVKRLIVNADDYGLAPMVSEGIRTAHRDGIVTSTSAMMNMPSASETLRVAQRECPRLGLGVHLVLTAGRPLLPAESIPSICSLSRDGAFPKRDALLAQSQTLSPDEVEAEWRAQIDRFVLVTGQKPTHFDSHHHSSFYTETLMQVLIRLAHEFDAAIRMPLTSLDVATAVLGAPPDSPFVAAAMHAIEATLESGQADAVRRPQRFEARFYGNTVSADLLNDILAALPAGTTEIMCHPSLDGPELARLSSYNTPRARELAALTQPGLRGRLQEQGVELITFREL